MPGYVVAEFEIVDQSAYLEYRDLAREAIREYGGTYLLRGGIDREIVEGDWPAKQGVVIISFDDAAQAKRWYHSPSYAKALEVAPRAMKRRIAIYDSPPPQAS